MVEPERPAPAEDAPSGDVYSVANMITILRLLLTPVFFTVLVIGEGKYDVVAFFLFVVAASTDFLDGMVARRTGTVTTLGKAMDPLVDRLLIAFGVLGLYLLDRLPLWVVVILVLRDVYLLYGAWVLERHGRRMPVLYIGKATTVVLLTGFSVLMVAGPPSAPRDLLGIPLLQIGLVLVYVGIVMSLTTAVLYTIAARRELASARAGER